MKKLLYVTLIIATSFVWSDVHLYSSLKDFKKGSERSAGKSKRKGNRSSSSSDDACGEMLGMLAVAAIAVWFAHNISVHYSDYPYSDDMKYNFIDFSNFPIKTKEHKTIKDNKTNKIIKDPETEIIKPDRDEKKLKKENHKNYYYTIEGGGLHYGNNGKGYFGALRGKSWKIIGPEIEFRHIADNEDYLDLYAFGVNIPILQISELVSDFYIQSAHMRGILKLDGVAFGVIINSYPYKPFSLMLRIGKHIYEKGEYDIEYIDLEGRIGVIYNRFELFAGYRILETEYASLEGAFVGIKSFF